MSTTSCYKAVDRLESRARDMRTVGRQEISDRLPAAVQPATDLQITAGDTCPHARPVGALLSVEILHALRGALAPAMMIASHMENDCSLAPADREDAARIGRSVQAAVDIIQTLRQDGAL